MAMRDFRDSDGVHWVVWSTVPWAASVLDSFRGGWLTFVSPTSRRRVMPIPAGWEEAPDSALEEICRAAARLRVSPGGGVPVIDIEDRKRA